MPEEAVRAASQMPLGGGTGGLPGRHDRLDRAASGASVSLGRGIGSIRFGARRRSWSRVERAYCAGDVGAPDASRVGGSVSPTCGGEAEVRGRPAESDGALDSACFVVEEGVRDASVRGSGGSRHGGGFGARAGDRDAARIRGRGSSRASTSRATRRRRRRPRSRNRVVRPSAYATDVSDPGVGACGGRQRGVGPGPACS